MITRDQFIGLGFVVAIIATAALTYFGKADPTYSLGAILGAFFLWVQDKPAFVKKFFGGNDSDPPAPPPPAVAAGLLILMLVFSNTACTAFQRGIVAKSVLDLAPCLFDKIEANHPAEEVLLECNVPGELLDDARKLMSAHKTASAHRAAAKDCK